MFRFWIALVVIDMEDGKPSIRETDGVMYESVNFNSAAAEAESRWPGCQISVTRVGRILTASASDTLPMASGASG